MNIAVIGCGLIGNKRVQNIQPEDKIFVVCDTKKDLAYAMANNLKCDYTTDWKAAVMYPNVEVVIIATTHNTLAEVTSFAIQNGKHVLVEKPAARNMDEVLPVLKEYDNQNRKTIVKVGFNHRFHPAMWKAKEIIDSGIAGDIMFIRGRYGHGGRVGYDGEWRANPEISGGGELLDQGMHLIDLSRWYMGDFTKVTGSAKTFFWNMPVDDNAFMILETAKGQIAQLHVSWTEWKNLFSLEIYGRYAKLHIEGLGGSYGTERLSVYHMKPEMGPPETVIYEYPGADTSWKKEWENFRESILLGNTVVGGIEDAYQALKIVRSIYQQNQYSY